MTIENLFYRDKEKRAYWEFITNYYFEGQIITGDVFDPHADLPNGRLFRIHSPEDLSKPSFVVPHKRLIVGIPKDSNIIQVNIDGVGGIYRLPRGSFELTLVDRETGREVTPVTGFNLNE